MVEIVRRIFRREKKEPLENKKTEELKEVLKKHGLPELDLSSMEEGKATYIKGLLESIEKQHGTTLSNLVEEAKKAAKEVSVDPYLVQTLENWKEVVKSYHGQGRLDEAITGINQAALQVLAIREATRHNLPRGDVIELFSTLGYKKALEKLKEIEKKTAQ